MNDIYQNLRAELEGKLVLRKDKPEETIDSTLKALWMFALGLPVSAEKAVALPLPDLDPEKVNLLAHLIGQRLNGHPLAYITRRQNFMGIELICDQRALIPRKETEILGTRAFEICQLIRENKTDIRVMDVCCGSGNLGLALASKMKNVMVWSSDLSEDAVALTWENIEFLQLGKQVNAVQSDLFQSFETDGYFGRFDLIVCNPPYISSSKVKKMDAEISENEPLLAFDGGMIGIKIIQRFIREAPRFLVKGGWIAFEVGLGQGTFISQLCESSGLYRIVEPVSDDDGNTRVIAAQC